MSQNVVSLSKDLGLVRDALARAHPHEAFPAAIMVGAAQEVLKSAVDKFDDDGNNRLSFAELARLKAFWTRTGSMGERLCATVDVYVAFESETP